MIATNNGSFPWRGTELGARFERAAAQQKSGAIANQELRSIQDRLIRQTIETQVAAGLELVTDGMVRLEDPIAYLAARLGGVKVGDETADLPGLASPCRRPVIEAEVVWSEPLLVEDYVLASEGCSRPVKVVIPGPYSFARLAVDHAYGEPMSLATGMATILNREIRALQTAGATFVQIDEPLVLAHPDDFPIFTRVWEVLGRGITLTLGLHLPGGNVGGLYPAILRLKGLGCISLDCVSGAAALDPLAASPLPEGTRLGIGVVDGRNPQVERVERIVEMVRAFKSLPSYDRVLIGPASDLGSLPPDIATAKLSHLARAARTLSA